MFQQHHGESLSEAWTRFNDLLKKVPQHGIDHWLQIPATKNVNSISLAKGEEERSDKTDETLDNTVKPTVTETEIPVMEAERSNETKNRSIKKAERKEVKEVLSSWPIEYYLKHRINEKLIEGLVDNN
ncbi:hypothetical protein Tco_0288338, partial [Tanacetum coccineum]